ncbi:MAG: hypothetical protein KA436_08280 [Oligoflexales bacterium]|nr:hypothetical protein [Oligoflexales bacterium]
MAILLEKSVKMGSYLAKIKIPSVPPDKNRPDGFKINFVLLSLGTIPQVG